MTEFKVGDLVEWDGIYGEVESIVSDRDYPVRISWRKGYILPTDFTIQDIKMLKLVRRNKEKREITMYRHTYRQDGVLMQSPWREEKEFIKGYKIIKTETKIIEIEE